jgi:hypothetical protein
LVAFGLLDVKIISEDYVDRTYRVTKRSEKILDPPLTVSLILSM